MPGWDVAIRDAISLSHLRSLPQDITDRLIRGATRLDAPAGKRFIHEGSASSMFLVVAGLVRGFLTSPSGRQSTIRYAKPGELIGTASLFISPHRAGAQALTNAVLLAFNVADMKHIAAKDPRVGMVLCSELAERLQNYFDQLYGTEFGTLRQRVIRHLLDLTAQTQQGPELVTAVSQQSLADAVGSVREVVARVLQTLRSEGLIATTPDGIALLHPLRLHAEAWARDL
jgi:CRP/FNR family transcriptional regulator, cyclic AMP receptor protein